MWQIQEASNVIKSITTTVKAWTNGYCKSHMRNILDLSAIMALGNLKPDLNSAIFDSLVFT